MKNNKKVQINEDALVELIYNITERTIAERIEKGELAKVEKPKKTTKVQVTESQLAELVKTGRVLNVKKKIKLVKEGDGQSEYNIAQNILQLLQSKYNEEKERVKSVTFLYEKVKMIITL